MIYIYIVGGNIEIQDEYVNTCEKSQATASKFGSWKYTTDVLQVQILGALQTWARHVKAGTPTPTWGFMVLIDRL